MFSPNTPELNKPQKDKKAKTALNGFIEIVNKFKRKPNKLQ